MEETFLIFLNESKIKMNPENALWLGFKVLNR